jgi:hypothetical protein
MDAGLKEFYSAFLFFRLMSLQGKVLNMLMPALYVLFQKPEKLAVGL